MPTPAAERRTSPRVPTSGSVTILFENPELISVPAELQETSDRGFRIAHNSAELAPGLEIQMREAGASKRARIVWTHLLDGRRVSGCMLL